MKYMLLDIQSNEGNTLKARGPTANVKGLQLSMGQKCEDPVPPSEIIDFSHC